MKVIDEGGIAGSNQLSEFTLRRILYILIYILYIPHTPLKRRNFFLRFTKNRLGLLQYRNEIRDGGGGGEIIHTPQYKIIPGE